MEKKRHGVSAEPLPELGHGEVTGAGRGCLTHTHQTAATCCWLPVTQRGWAGLPGCCCYCSAAVLRSSSAGPWTHPRMWGVCLGTDRRTVPTVWQPRWQVTITLMGPTVIQEYTRSLKSNHVIHPKITESGLLNLFLLKIKQKNKGASLHLIRNV